MVKIALKNPYRTRVDGIIGPGRLYFGKFFRDTAFALAFTKTEGNLCYNGGGDGPPPKFKKLQNKETGK